MNQLFNRPEIRTLCLFIYFVDHNIMYNLRVVAHVLSLGIHLLATNPSIVVQKCGKIESSDNQILQVNQKSDGSGYSTSSNAMVQLCYTSKYLQVTYTLFNQSYLPLVNYSNCNDPVYNSDVAEIFIGPTTDSGTHCYMEVDFSPYGTPFQSGIFNPNLNYSGIIGTPLNCTTSGIQYNVSLSSHDTHGSRWSVQANIPWLLVDCVPGCPSSTSKSIQINNDLDSNFISESIHTSTSDAISFVTVSDSMKSHELNKCSGPSQRSGMIYNANFYRINELVPVATCTATSCEYLAWSPTLVSPPAFHEPLYFGTIILE